MATIAALLARDLRAHQAKCNRVPTPTATPAPTIRAASEYRVAPAIWRYGGQSGKLGRY